MVMPRLDTATQGDWEPVKASHVTMSMKEDEQEPTVSRHQAWTTTTMYQNEEKPNTVQGQTTMTGEPQVPQVTMSLNSDSPGSNVFDIPLRLRRKMQWRESYAVNIQHGAIILLFSGRSLEWAKAAPRLDPPIIARRPPWN